MTTTRISLLAALTAGFLSLGCGGAVNVEDDNTGTLQVDARLSSSAEDFSPAAVGTVDSLNIRFYEMSISDDASCTGEFVDLVSEVANTTDCVVNPTDVASFTDIAGGVTLSSGDMPAGTYSCLKITICDQLVWTTPDLPSCSGTQYLDVFGDRDVTVAEVSSFYFSTTGTGEDASALTPSDPGLLLDGITVSPADLTQITVDFNLVATDEVEGIDCEVPQPHISVIQ